MGDIFVGETARQADWGVLWINLDKVVSLSGRNASFDGEKFLVRNVNDGPMLVSHFKIRVTDLFFLV